MVERRSHRLAILILPEQLEDPLLDLPLRRGPASEARACYEELGIDGGGAAS